MVGIMSGGDEGEGEFGLRQFERNRYFYGTPMTVRDFEDEQAYHNGKRWITLRVPCTACSAGGIPPLPGRDRFTLSKSQWVMLREIIMAVRVARARWRAGLYDTMGFAGTSSRGLGILALFAGESGTGKTTAAKVVAAELNLELFRIDLSTVVSKYIGETEKNLRRIFDAAEDGGAILFFDEADALFGRRSGVKDSRDRYACVEVNPLLRMMEEYRGLIILSVKDEKAMDPSCISRIRYLIRFPER
jgi:hypothetical protein